MALTHQEQRNKETREQKDIQKLNAITKISYDVKCSA